MRVLLDTHVLLWALGTHDRLPPATRELLEDPDTEVLFSAASIWEVAIKAALGRADFSARPEVMSAALVADLPLHHRDPFDRLLVAQAVTEPARLLTADPQLPPYSDLVKLLA